MSASCLLFAAAAAFTGVSLPPEQVLDFEGRTLVRPYAPSVPEGWLRIIDTKQAEPRGPRIEHGEFPHFVVVEHRSDPNPRSGGRFVRIRLMGAAARLETEKPFSVGTRFSHVYGGYYRYDIPARLRPAGPGGPRTKLLLEARLLNKDGSPLDVPPRSVAVDVPPGCADWRKLPEIVIDDPPAEAAKAVLSLTVRSKDFAGHVDIDACYLVREPKVQLRTQKPGNLFSPGEKVVLSVTATGLPEGSLNTEFSVNDHTGRVLHQAKGAAMPRGGDYSGLVTVPETGLGWFRAGLRLSGKTGPVAAGDTSFAVLPRVKRSGRVGLVVDAQGEPPAYFAALQPGFVVLRVGRESLPRADVLADRIRSMRDLVGRTPYVWLDCPFDADALAPALQSLARSVSTLPLLIPQDYSAEEFTPLLKGPAQRDVLRARLVTAERTVAGPRQAPAPEGTVLAVEDDKADQHQENVRFAILSAAKSLAAPDIVWRIAELKKSGINNVALRLPACEGAPPPGVLAAAYWAPRIMDARFEGGSGIARDVHTLLFSDGGETGKQAFLLCRSADGRTGRSFTVAAGDSPGLAARDLMGNRLSLRSPRPSRQGGVVASPASLDVDVSAGAYSAALEEVDLGLLRTSMSVVLTEGAGILSKYEFQPFAVSFVNHLPEKENEKENMSAVVVPSLSEGWKMKPAFSGEVRLVKPQEAAEFRFRLRPAFHAVPGKHYARIEIYPRTLSGGRFTVYKALELVSPLTLHTEVRGIDEGRLALSIKAALAADFGRTPGVMHVGIRTPFGTSRSKVFGLVPGGQARPVKPSFVLPASEKAYSVEVWLTERGGGLFYNYSRTVEPSTIGSAR